MDDKIRNILKTHGRLSQDALTLANLAVIAARPDRRAVLERLDQVFRIPAPHTLDEALSDRAVFEAWFQQVVDRATALVALPWNRPARLD